MREALAITALVFFFGGCLGALKCLVVDFVFEAGGLASLGRGLQYLVAGTCLAVLVLYGLGASFGIVPPWERAHQQLSVAKVQQHHVHHHKHHHR